ncbi:uroporphyrinogen-III synthase [Aliiruegeria sabulilitoris]|uniref:uroporphyrinogen-III synthase n=1 Tax=Aliiruegeria sabulilitoris TaxID=1510458 RepID=UPI0008377E6D|nr:uroporphyrinogen-III synthase [Pseudoruegeria sp. M32A2M]
MASKVNLRNTTLLLTRPEAACRRFSRQVEETIGKFARTVIAPLFEIVPVEIASPPRLHEEIAFTSENGVRALSQQQKARGRPAWCVGARTAEMARAEGYSVRMTRPTVASLTTALIEEAAGIAIVHVTGQHRRGNLAETLREAGRTSRTLVAYDQRALTLRPDVLNILKKNVDIIAPVFSPRSANLLSQAAEQRSAHVHVVAISEATAKAWVARPGERVLIAASPDASGILSAMGSLFDADPSA